MILQSERDKVAHLLRRFGLGASETELDYYSERGLSGAIDRLINFKDNNWAFDLDPQAFANKQGVVNIRVMQAIWYFRILATHNPLEEKLTIFWHHHFATSAQKVENSYTMARHIDVLRKNCIGRFQDLLLNISKDPGMLYWLDNHENVKGKPNENFAREIMELFTLGIGNYTEQDVQEAARAFTGWCYGVRRRINPQSPRGLDQFIFAADRHDDTEKTVLGQTGRWNGDDIARILCEHPQTPRYIAKKMWEFFVYDSPETAVIDRIASKFKESGLEIAALVRAIMESPEFYSDKSARKLVKSPVDFAIVTVRQLGLGEAMMQRAKDGIANPSINEESGLNVNLVRVLAPSFACHAASKSMGMELLYPPDVAGWNLGENWITSATMLERVKWADRLFLGSTAPAGEAGNVGGNIGGQRIPAVGYNAASLFGANPTPQKIVDALCSVFDVVLPEEKKKTLEQAAENALKPGTNLRTLGDASRAVCRLIFGSPEFQYA